jgi:hypothetical protein
MNKMWMRPLGIGIRRLRYSQDIWIKLFGISIFLCWMDESLSSKFYLQRWNGGNYGMWSLFIYQFALRIYWSRK